MFEDIDREKNKGSKDFYSHIDFEISSFVEVLLFFWLDFLIYFSKKHSRHLGLTEVHVFYLTNDE